MKLLTPRFCLPVNIALVARGCQQVARTGRPMLARLSRSGTVGASSTGKSRNRSTTTVPSVRRQSDIDCLPTDGWPSLSPQVLAGIKFRQAYTDRMACWRFTTASMTRRTKRVLSLLTWALAFATAGFVARYLSHHKFETRYLIPAFCLAAALLEFVIRPALGIRRDLLALTLNCAAATIAIIVIKWLIEGPHPSLRWLINGIQAWPW